jgi:hypothetical protein
MSAADAPGIYHQGNRTLQDEFDTRRLADRIESLLVGDAVDPGLKGFIESRDFFFLATCDAHGHPNCSYKGGDPGFVPRWATSRSIRAWGCSSSTSRRATGSA